MVDATRAMLDELMGKERNVPLEERSNKELHFWDDEVCKYAICGLCPYTLFSNTKSFLGECQSEMHDQLGMDKIQAEWDALTEAEKHKYGYEQRLLDLVEQLVKDMDRKIERQKERAVKESLPRMLTAADKAKLDDFLKRQGELVEQSEQLAEAGDVDASMARASRAEKLKEEHDQTLVTLTAPDRIMTVCEVCGVFINCTDSEQRQLASAAALGKTALGNVVPVSKALGDHLEGKQYLGWLAIRQKYKELSDKRKDLQSSDRPRQSRSERDSSRSRPNERPSERDRDREREDRHHSSSREDRYGREQYSGRGSRDERGDRSTRDNHGNREGRYEERSSRDGQISREERHRRDDRRQRERDRY